MAGIPRSFATGNIFKKKFVEYVDYCDKKKRIANVAGFAVFCGINKDTFYAQKNYYPEEFGAVQAILEDYTINADVHYSLKKFYLQCKFDYKDKPEEDRKGIDRITIIDDLPSDKVGGEDE